jgi:hypothetical protein
MKKLNMKTEAKNKNIVTVEQVKSKNCNNKNQHWPSQVQSENW